MQKIYFYFLCMGMILQTNQQFATTPENLIPYSNAFQANPNDINKATLLSQYCDLKPVIHQENDLFLYFSRPITFTRKGIEYYFNYTYNHEKYTDYLPYNLSHMIQFLEYGQTQEQDEKYALSIIKLFSQKIKGCDCINAYSFITALPKIGNQFQAYVQKKETSFLHDLQKSLKQRFSNLFSSYYTYFQKNPDAFLDALAEQIAKKTNGMQTQQHIDAESVKKDIVKFIELCISKLIWTPDEAYNAWISIHEIAEISHTFLEKRILTNIDALDDIYWSLVHRFCYFIEIAHVDISLDVLLQIMHDIEHEELLLFDIEEQEDLILSKKHYMLRKLKNYCTYRHPKILPPAK